MPPANITVDIKSMQEKEQEYISLGVRVLNPARK